MIEMAFVRNARRLRKLIRQNAELVKNSCIIFTSVKPTALI